MLTIPRWALYMMLVASAIGTVMLLKQLEATRGGRLL